MNSVRLFVLLGACAVSLNLGHAALADDPPTMPPTGTAAQDGPSADDLKKSKTRGIFFKAPGSDSPFQLEKSGTSAKDTTVKGKTNKSTSTKSTVKKAHIKTVSAAHGAVKYGTKTKTNIVSKKTASLQNPGAKSKNIDQGASDNLSADTSDNEEGSIIRARLNKAGKVPTYKDGDKMEVTVNASKDCNLVIYDFDGKGTLTQIFPNDFQKDGAVKAGSTVTIGGANSNFDFQVSVNDGAKSQQERLFVFAYPAMADAPVSVAMTKIPSTPFRSVPMSLEQYRKMVNQSKVYFARSVLVKPKKVSNGRVTDVQTVADELNDGSSAPNKMELSFSVER